MNIRRCLIIGALALLGVGCATVTKDIKVDTETRGGADLTRYKTYAWIGSAQIINDPRGQWEPPQLDADAEIRWLIDRELRKKDMIEVTTKPDLLVGFAAGINMEALELVADPKTGADSMQNVPKGALVVVLADAATRVPVWVGTAVGDIQEKPSVEMARKRLDYAVTKMFKGISQNTSKSRMGYY